MRGSLSFLTREVSPTLAGWFTAEEEQGLLGEGPLGLLLFLSFHLVHVKKGTSGSNYQLSLVLHLRQPKSSRSPSVRWPGPLHTSGSMRELEEK